ncbi:MAG TPA: bacteriohemerythrin [Bacteroidota bacterium]|nr:bacteriohemerythrin [Bacteroidota bacterium]
MALIDWSNDLSVNIQEVDKQHKILINLINKLHEAMRVGQGKAALESILAELVVYTKTHFAYEESLFAQYGYPASASHKKEHDDLTTTVVDTQKQYHAGQLVMSVEVLQFLKQWLTKHIQMTDKAYTAHFKSKGVV